MTTGFDPDPRFARYPFLAGARAAVERANIDIPTVVESERAVVARARDRIDTAVETGGVGTPHRSPAVELLSYPVARVLVSIVDEPALVDRYTAAEAATALERYWADQAVSDRRTVDRRPMTLRELLEELELEAAVDRRYDPAEPEPWNERENAFMLQVEAYLDLAGGRFGTAWGLATRPLRDGELPVDGAEFEVLLETALAGHIATDLPLTVPDAVADPLGPAAAEIRDSLADHDLAVTFDTVVPGLFPPCMRALLARADEEGLPDHSLFSLTSFLLAAGLTAGEIVALTGVSDDRAAAIEQRVERLGSSGQPQYAAPSCTSMQAYGDCVNMDEICETIAHPLEYYDNRLGSAEDLTDWRVAGQASTE